MDKSREIDEALCALNQELLDLKRSKEYQIAVKVCKFMYAVKHFQLKPLFIAMEHRKIEKQLAKGHKSNENFLTFNNEITTKSRVAVYTCITGNYDRPLEPLYVPDNIDYYIVTDMEIDRNSKWKKIDINSIEVIQKFDNTRKARYIKTHPHILFDGYEYSIWVDSNFRVIGDLSRYIKCVGTGVPFASNWHPLRNSIYTELEACISRKKDDPELLARQIEHYRKGGMPDNFGLIETNMIVRRHGDDKCKQLMEAWWTEMTKWSKRDQLSLPYVIWKLGYTMNDFGFIGTEIRNNPSVQVVLHDVKYRCPTS